MGQVPAELFPGESFSSGPESSGKRLYRYDNPGMYRRKSRRRFPGLQEADDSVMRMPLHVRIRMCACERMKVSRQDFPDAHRIDVWFDVRYGKEKGQAFSDPPSRIGDTNVLLLSRQFREDCAHADERQSEDDCECQCFHVICFLCSLIYSPQSRSSVRGTIVVLTTTVVSSVTIAGPSSVIARPCFTSWIPDSNTLMTFRFRCLTSVCLMTQR